MLRQNWAIVGEGVGWDMVGCDWVGMRRRVWEEMGMLDLDIQREVE
jgi:hypothetical protein